MTGGGCEQLTTPSGMFSGWRQVACAHIWSNTVVIKMLCNIEKQTIEIKILPSDLTYMDSTSDSILNHKTIESRWSVKWSEAKLFESNPDPKKEKRYVTEIGRAHV